MFIVSYSGVKQLRLVDASAMQIWSFAKFFKIMHDHARIYIFSAPEITDNRTYSEKCDIWAMGIIMFKL